MEKILKQWNTYLNFFTAQQCSERRFPFSDHFGCRCTWSSCLLKWLLFPLTWGLEMCNGSDGQVSFSISPDEETQSYQGEGKRCCVRFLPHNSFSHLKRVLILQWWALVAALWNICLQCCNFPTEFRVLEAWHRRDGQGTDNALKFCVFSWATSPDLYPGDL